MATLKAYRVLVNEAESLFGGTPNGLNYRHVKADTEQEAKADAEKYYGTVVEIEEKTLASKNTLFTELEEGKEYEILADSDFTNDTLKIKKEGEWVTTTIRGGEFSEEGFTHSYKVQDVFPKIDFLVDTKITDMTLATLEALDFEIYATVSALKEMPQEFVGLVKCL